MQRLWVRWIALVLFVAVLGTVFVNLGQWQLHRLAERRARNAVITTNAAAPVADATTVFGRPIVAADQWRRVTVTGTFDADHQYVVRYRTNADDDSGYEILTPLRTGNGLNLLVDRGFVVLAAGTRIPDTAPAPPAGTVTVVGHVRVDQTGRTGAITPLNGQIRFINAPAVAPTLPYPIADGYLDALTMTPAQQGDFQPVAVPEISDGPHFWYAVQWFMFTGIAVLGIVVFVRGDLRERRAARAAAAGEPPADQDEPALAGSEHGSTAG